MGCTSSQPDENPAKPGEGGGGKGGGGGGVGGVYSLGPATAAVVEPGKCQFTEEWGPSTLLATEKISRDTHHLTFSLPNQEQGLGLSTCACLLLQGGKDEDGDPFCKPYTPVSTNALLGKFELIVKAYPNGNLSKHLGLMKAGDALQVRHIPFNVKIQYPFNKRHIGMLVGGTGIAPMIQALHAILGTEGDDTKVTMLYGSRTQGDILGKDALDEWCATHKSQLSVTHVLSAEPEGSDWEGARGFINEQLIEQHMPKPDENGMVFICGPPPMYTALCGSRNEPEVDDSCLLGKLGYKEEHVFKF